MRGKEHGGKRERRSETQREKENEDEEMTYKRRAFQKLGEDEKI